MTPQARGPDADIWAFGVVLFEMLGGKRLFEGETVSAFASNSNLRRSYDVTRDAAWILAITTPFANQPRQIEVVTDWASELARLAPRGKR